MGCCVSITSSYTVAELDDDVARLTPQLPVAELLNGDIIKLPGVNGFFNSNSLLDPSWLRGRLTVDEYRNAIDTINKRTAHSQIDLRKIYPSSERAYRVKLRHDAGMAVVKELNECYKSVRFTYQQTMENTKINTSASTDPLVRMINQRGPPVGNALVTVLFITPQ